MSSKTENLKPETPKSWKQMLLAIPTPNTAANAKYDEESGLVTVTVKNIKPDYMIPPFSRFDLLPHGALPNVNLKSFFSPLNQGDLQKKKSRCGLQ